MNLKKPFIIGGLSLAVVGGGFFFQSTDFGNDVFASSTDKSKLLEQAELTEAEAEKIATDKVSGEVIEKEMEKEKDTIVFEFEIKTDSGVKEVEIDGNSGEILEIEDEDEDDENE